jgi:hypothetical protein
MIAGITLSLLKRAVLAFQIVHYNGVESTKKGLPSEAVVERAMGILYQI